MVPVPMGLYNLLLIRPMVAKERAVGKTTGDNTRKSLGKVFGK